MLHVHALPSASRMLHVHALPSASRMLHVHAACGPRAVRLVHACTDHGISPARVPLGGRSTPGTSTMRVGLRRSSSRSKGARAHRPLLAPRKIWNGRMCGMRLAIGCDATMTRGHAADGELRRAAVDANHWHCSDGHGDANHWHCSDGRGGEHARPHAPGRRPVTPVRAGHCARSVCTQEGILPLRTLVHSTFSGGGLRTARQQAAYNPRSLTAVARWALRHSMRDGLDAVLLMLVTQDEPMACMDGR